MQPSKSIQPVDGRILAHLQATNPQLSSALTMERMTMIRIVIGLEADNKKLLDFIRSWVDRIGVGSNEGWVGEFLEEARLVAQSSGGL